MSATIMYDLLFLALFVAGLVVIASSHLESQLGRPVAIADDSQPSWPAGALGSDFDSEEAIRQATYSRREHERRELAAAHEAEDWPPSARSSARVARTNHG